MDLSEWLPTRNFGKQIYSTFWEAVPNNANDNRKQEIYDETEDLFWVYLGNGFRPGGPFPKTSRTSFDNYTFPPEYHHPLMKKTIQGNYRKQNKVQIWIGTAPKLSMPGAKTIGVPPRINGFFKIYYDPANNMHSLSKHDGGEMGGNLVWSLGFPEIGKTPPMAINYK